MCMRPKNVNSVDMTLGALAEALSARLQGDASIRITAVATLADAGAGQISFLANRRYRPQLDTTAASAVILSAEFAGDCPTAAVVTDNPYLGSRCGRTPAATSHSAPRHSPIPVTAKA